MWNHTAAKPQHMVYTQETEPMNTWWRAGFLAMLILVFIVTVICVFALLMAFS